MTERSIISRRRPRIAMRGKTRHRPLRESIAMRMVYSYRGEVHRRAVS